MSTLAPVRIGVIVLTGPIEDGNLTPKPWVYMELPLERTKNHQKYHEFRENERFL